MWWLFLHFEQSMPEDVLWSSAEVCRSGRPERRSCEHSGLPTSHSMFWISWLVRKRHEHVVELVESSRVMRGHASDATQLPKKSIQPTVHLDEDDGVVKPDVSFDHPTMAGGHLSTALLETILQEAFFGSPNQAKIALAWRPHLLNCNTLQWQRFMHTSSSVFGMGESLEMEARWSSKPHIIPRLIWTVRRKKHRSINGNGKWELGCEVARCRLVSQSSSRTSRTMVGGRFT